MTYCSWVASAYLWVRSLIQQHCCHAHDGQLAAGMRLSEQGACGNDVLLCLQYLSELATLP